MERMNLKSRQISHPFDLSQISFSPTVILHHFPSNPLPNVKLITVSLFHFSLSLLTHHMEDDFLSSLLRDHFLHTQPCDVILRRRGEIEGDRLYEVSLSSPWMNVRSRGWEGSENIKERKCRDKFMQREKVSMTSGRVDHFHSSKGDKKYTSERPMHKYLHLSPSIFIILWQNKVTCLTDRRTRGEMKKSNIHPS